MTATVAVAELEAVAAEAGLDRIGITTAAPFRAARQALEERREQGLHGGMQFTYRNPPRSTEPERILPGAKSLVVGARSYLAETPPAPGSAADAAVARYAWSDHYSELRRGLEAVAARLRNAGWKCRVVVDDNALVDRAAAQRAGIGSFGKNANILLPGQGSWFVLGAVVTDAELPESEPVADQCGSCRRCLDGCPTDAIVAPGVVDGRRCLAWLVQAEGDFPVEYRSALGNRLYGCDDCQEVCPPNRRRAEPGPSSGTAWVEVLELLQMTDAELLERFGVWYIAKREPRYLRRNALVVLGNVGDAHDRGVEAALATYLRSGDPMLAEHAEWAATELGRADLLAAT